MAVSFELKAQTEATALDVFNTMSDLRRWDHFAGVLVRGPERVLAEGDRVELCVSVLRREIRSGCLIRQVMEPTATHAGYVDIVSVDGPFDSRLTGTVATGSTGCELTVEVHGIGKGAARLLERPLELIMQQWANHQLRHLLTVATRPT